MNIQIPSQLNPILKQTNQSSILGTISSSYNLDLTSDLGKITSSKTVLSKSSTALAVGDFGGLQSEGVGAIVEFSNQIWLISGDAIWVGGNSPSDAISKDASSGTPTVAYQDSDLKGFNSTIYASSQNNIYRFNSGSWVNMYSYATTGLAHILETHNGSLYFTFDNYKVGNIDSANTVTVATGAGVFNSGLLGFEISFLKSDGQNLWIGFMNTSGNYGGKTFIYRWDGTTATQAQVRYTIDSRGILAGTIVNGVPYVMDSNGRLLAFNGSTFKEVARLPFKSNEYLYGVGTKYNQRGIHPNGMTYDSINLEILINISNMNYFTGNIPTFYSFPGGVWAYKEETGLIHKYSPCYQGIANTGSNSLTDYGQYNVIYSGAIQALGLRPTSGENGRVVFGNTIPVGSTPDITTTSCKAVFCADDSLDVTQNYAWFTTTEIHSQSITEIWQELAVMYRKFFSASDKIVVKYRTENYVSVSAPVTWTAINTLTTTTDVSAFSAGDEIQLVQGGGSGKSFHISSITFAAGTYTIVLDDSMPVGTSGYTGIAVFDKWIKLGEAVYTDIGQYNVFKPIDKNVSPFIQLKVCMQFTGTNQIYGLNLTSKSQQ